MGMTTSTTPNAEGARVPDNPDQTKQTQASRTPFVCASRVSRNVAETDVEPNQAGAGGQTSEEGICNYLQAPA